MWLVGTSRVKEMKFANKFTNALLCLETNHRSMAFYAAVCLSHSLFLLRVMLALWCRPRSALLARAMRCRPSTHHLFSPLLLRLDTLFHLLPLRTRPFYLFAFRTVEVVSSVRTLRYRQLIAATLLLTLRHSLLMLTLMALTIVFCSMPPIALLLCGIK